MIKYGASTVHRQRQHMTVIHDTLFGIYAKCAKTLKQNKEKYSQLGVVILAGLVEGFFEVALDLEVTLQETVQWEHQDVV